MNILLARYQLNAHTDLLREIRGLMQEADHRAWKLTLLTGKATDEDALPPDLEIIRVRGSHDAFVRKFRELCSSGRFDRTLALEALPGADFCIPSELVVYPEFPRTKFGIFEREEAKKGSLEQELYRAPSSTVILASGELQKLTLRLRYGVIPSRIHTVPPLFGDISSSLPESDDAVNALRREFDCAEKGDILIVHPAADWYDAGVDRTLFALAILPQKIQSRCRLLVLSSEDDRDASDLRELAEKNGFVAGKVFHRREISNRRALMQAADLLVLPARNEFAGNAMTDGLACGLPIICSSSCGYSPFVQAAGCTVLCSPFDDEIFQEALAYTIPRLAVLREMLLNRAQNQPKLSRAAAIMDCVEQFKCADVPKLSSQEAREAVLSHLEQLRANSALKSDRKRNITRCETAAGTALIVKEFKKNHFWEGNRHLRRCQNGTALMRFFTPQSVATVTIPESDSKFIIFRDCGSGNFHSGDYVNREDAKNLFAACGAILAILHTAGIYHKDTKPANFVLNERCEDECPYHVCLVDCDNVSRLPLPMDWDCRIHNVAQFIAGTGPVAAAAGEAKWTECIKAFQDGYIRHALLSQNELKSFWDMLWTFIAKKRHIEYNLPFLCDETNLKKIRKHLH
ncbi:MAG: glycosyltransferase [Lentisphaeria bacterium]|nr:glycosyltransferase [Lentisphaeria bacterium]